MSTKRKTNAEGGICFLVPLENGSSLRSSGKSVSAGLVI